MSNKQELEKAGFIAIVDRTSTQEEKQKFHRDRVIDLVRVEGSSKLPKDDGRMIGAIPKETPIEKGPVVDINELKLKLKTEDPLLHEKLGTLVDTYCLSYTNQKNEVVIGPLIPVIYHSWENFLDEYVFTDNVEGKSVLNEDNVWNIVYAIAQILNRKKTMHLPVPEIFLKLYEEGPIDYHKVDHNTRNAAFQLSKMGLAKYIPKSMSNISFEQKQFNSFKEFHENIKKNIGNAIKEYGEKGQSTLVLDEAYEILSKRGKGRDYFDKFYGQKQS